MEELIYRSKLAEQAERYEDMISFMKRVISESTSLSVQQRNLLSVGYKNIVGTRRTAWRTLTSTESKQEARGNQKRVQLVRILRQRIQDEMNSYCQQILDLITNILRNKENNTDSQVFFLKMQGDYYRYMAQYQGAPFNKFKYGNTASDEADRVYSQAMKLANADLPPTHPIRLGLALNYSVFYYEVREQHQEACGIARNAFDQAIAELDNLDEEQYKDSTTIMQLIRDNLTLWSSELQEGQGPKGTLNIEEL